MSLDEVAPTPTEVFRKDYAPTPFNAQHVDLRLELHDNGTATVTCTTRYVRQSGREGEALVLDGDPKPAKMELVSVSIGGQVQPDVCATDKGLSIASEMLPTGFEPFTVTICTRLNAKENTSLEGLYQSAGVFCTQMEAEGFRNMTYFYDRPDIMATYTTTIVANKQKYPCLLSNGNDIARGDEANGQHFVTWEDPWPKPCYLFAVVAGDLAHLEDKFVTMSGKVVQLRIFVTHGNESQISHAMTSLQKSFKWDEEEFGREYDLQQFNIVAVPDFTAGAMENKSLNVFNDKYILSDPKTATDTDQVNVEAVVAHEYFHNWTGNRVTCRDWFQLTLKEGLTVYREQEFSADMNSRSVKRIQDALGLRSSQYVQDAGPLAHPIRPESYISMDNFYTTTVYEKGAEVIRMIATIVGKAGFRKGTDLYFERHDGQAVECEDFVRAMEAANGVDLTQFRRWYSQAGTPTVDIAMTYNADLRQCTLTVRQSCPATPGQPIKEPFDIPLALGFLGRESKKPILMHLQGEETPGEVTKVLRVQAAEQTYTFCNVSEQPVLSLLRDFSAPIKVTSAAVGLEELQFLMQYDVDPFTRWDSGQRLAEAVLKALLCGERPSLDGLVAAFRNTLADPSLDPAFKALALGMPSESWCLTLASELPQGFVDVDTVHAEREAMLRSLTTQCRAQLWEVYRATQTTAPNTSPAEAAGHRALGNTVLGYLLRGAEDDPEAVAAAVQQFEGGATMTEQFGALSALVRDCPAAAAGAAEAQSRCLEAFYTQWQAYPLVVNKWLSLKAAAADAQGFQDLLSHEAFSIGTPNKVYALFGGFCSVLTKLHDRTGSGYGVVRDGIERLDSVNAQVAARMADEFSNWRHHSPDRQELMKSHMAALLKRKGLSSDTYEILTKSLE